MTRIRVEVPATSANLGPGFDTLALALDIVDTFTVDLDPGGSEVILTGATGDTADFDPRDNLICRAYHVWGEETGTTLPGARFTLESHIPIGKGFGSSASCIVAGLAAAASPRRWEASRRLSATVKGSGRSMSSII
jgi:homoserine kinase